MAGAWPRPQTRLAGWVLTQDLHGPWTRGQWVPLCREGQGWGLGSPCPSGSGGRALSSPGQAGRRGVVAWTGRGRVPEGRADAVSAARSMNRGSGNRARPPAPPTTATDWPPWDVPEPLGPPDQPPAPTGSRGAAVCTPRATRRAPPLGVLGTWRGTWPPRGRRPVRPTLSPEGRGRLGINNNI